MKKGIKKTSSSLQGGVLSLRMAHYGSLMARMHSVALDYANNDVGVQAGRYMLRVPHVFVRVVPMSEAQDCWYSRYFMVPRRGESFRPVLDLRALNKDFRVYKFRMLMYSKLLQSAPRAIGLPPST